MAEQKPRARWQFRAHLKSEAETRISERLPSGGLEQPKHRPPLRIWPRAMKRWQHNLLLPLIGILIGWAAASGFGIKPGIHAVSLGTAYASLAYIALTLAIGPLHVILGRATPVSTTDRRDIGIWGGIFAIIHVAAGLNVHLKGNYWAYFFQTDVQPALMALRYDWFGLANYSGLAATMIVLVLLAISNNVTLKKLRSVRWKRIQRVNYILGGVVVIHGIVYQIIEQRIPFGVGVFLVICATTCLLQLEGVRRRRNLPGEGR